MKASPDRFNCCCSGHLQVLKWARPQGISGPEITQVVSRARLTILRGRFGCPSECLKVFFLVSENAYEQACQALIRVRPFPAGYGRAASTASRRARLAHPESVRDA